MHWDDARRKIVLATALTLCVAVLASCAGSGAPATHPGKSRAAQPSDPEPRSGGVVRGGDFPGPDELDELQRESAPGPLFSSAARDVETWQLTGPFPEHIEVVPFLAEDSWNAALGEALARRPGRAVPTAAMHCAARELGQFFLQLASVPSESLQRFILARCNASVSAFQLDSMHSAIPERASDAEVFAKWRTGIDQTIRGQLQGGSRAIGIWFGRRDELAVAIVVSGVRLIDVEPVATELGADHRVVIRGESLKPIARAEAVIARGQHGFEICPATEGVVLPRFEFVCVASPDDDSAWIDLTLQEPGRVMGAIGLQLLVRSADFAATVYRRPSYTADLQAFDTASARAGLAELLNQLRVEAGLAPFEVDPAQSALATELAPHFFAASLAGADLATLDLIALGLVAGWSVEGVVQAGSFAAAHVVGTNDLGRLLSAALARPSARQALLGSNVDRIAIGPVLEVTDGVPSMAAIFGAYSLFSAEAHDANARRVYDLLEKRRRERGVGAPRFLVDAAIPAMQAAGLVQAGVDPRDALGELLDSSLRLLKRPVEGWLVEVSLLEDIEFPVDYLTRRDLEIAVGISHHQPPGEAWGRFVVLIVTAQPRARGV